MIIARFPEAAASLSLASKATAVPSAPAASRGRPQRRFAARLVGAGVRDAFVIKLNPSLSGDSSLISSTFLGGGGTDYGYAIAVDGSGTASLVGRTALAYDNMDRLIGVTENYAGGGSCKGPCSVLTQYQYDRMGNRIKIIDPLNHIRTFRYNAAGEQTAAIDGLGTITSWQYDALGRLVKQLDPRDRVGPPFGSGRMSNGPARAPLMRWASRQHSSASGCPRRGSRCPAIGRVSFSPFDIPPRPEILTLTA